MAGMTCLEPRLKRGGGFPLCNSGHFFTFFCTRDAKMAFIIVFFKRYRMIPLNMHICKKG